MQKTPLKSSKRPMLVDFPFKLPKRERAKRTSKTRINKRN